ncbi:Rft protein-domain-containing protein [Dipodascopsis tothii]|uniref:Rft protein-domain-containing protein n=1 Tax=Dipodascopsis tothii TaxID=44089 RepID=UPI0034CF3AD3
MAAPEPIMHRNRSRSISKRHTRRHSTIVVPPPAGLAAAAAAAPDTATPLLVSSARGVTVLIGLQVFSKLLTFTLNQALLRFISPDLFGLSTQLEFLALSVLFFSREAVRLSLQKQTTHARPDVYRIEGGVVEGTVSGVAQSVVNIGYVPILLGVPFAYAGCMWYAVRAADEARAVPYFRSAVMLYGVAAVVELLSEPMFALAQYRLQYRLRAICESAAVAVRCVVTFLLTVSGGRAAQILPFAVGQLAYAAVLTGAYACLVWESTRGRENGVFPKRIWRDEISSSPWFYFHRPTLRLASTVWVQSIFKHYLTEGDKVLASYFSTVAEQGVYALSGNYGSLLARTFFFPIEEASRALFSKLLAPPLTADNLVSSSDTLTAMVRVYAYLGMVVVTVGPPAAPFLLRVVAGSAWSATASSAPAVLRAYAYYVPLLALNGVLEAFVQSVSTTAAELTEQSTYMLVFSVIFALCGYVFMKLLRFGAQGLVLANMVNMTIRIGASLVWIRRYYAAHAGVLTEPRVPLSASVSPLSASTIDEKLDSLSESLGPLSEKTGGYDGDVLNPIVRPAVPAASPAVSPVSPDDGDGDTLDSVTDSSINDSMDYGADERRRQTVLFPLARRDARPSAKVAVAAAAGLAATRTIGAVTSWTELAAVAAVGAALVGVIAFDERALIRRAVAVVLPARAKTE